MVRVYSHIFILYFLESHSFFFSPLFLYQVGLKKKLRELENSSKKKEEEIVSLKVGSVFCSLDMTSPLLYFNKFLFLSIKLFFIFRDDIPSWKLKNLRL